MPRDYRSTLVSCDRLAADVRAPQGERDAARARAARIRERHPEAAGVGAAGVSGPVDATLRERAREREREEMLRRTREATQAVHDLAEAMRAASVSADRVRDWADSWVDDWGDDDYDGEDDPDDVDASSEDDQPANAPPRFNDFMYGSASAHDLAEALRERARAQAERDRVHANAVRRMMDDAIRGFGTMGESVRAASAPLGAFTRTWTIGQDGAVRETTGTRPDPIDVSWTFDDGSSLRSQDLASERIADSLARAASARERDLLERLRRDGHLDADD